MLQGQKGQDGCPRFAKAYLGRKSALPLPLVRLRPLHLPCTIAETWAPFLQRREPTESQDANEQLSPGASLPLEAIGQTGESAC